MSDDGSKVFFDTAQSLVPRATNGNFDVYEWHDGQLSLISDGQSASNSYFIDSSSDGSDVFLGTHSPLALQDTDVEGDLYDARISGGFPPPAIAPACSGDGCQGPLSPAPSLPIAATVSFGGPGNATAGAAPTTVKASAAVVTRVVRGPAFRVALRVPGQGRITISGAGIRPVARSVAGAGTYRLRVTLTPRMDRLLHHRRRLKLGLSVGYAPAGGQAASVRFGLTVKA
jgi:hypothetical protein